MALRRVPGWIHPQAARGPGAWRPGTAAPRPRVVPQQAFTRQLAAVPLYGGTAVSAISSGGSGTVQVGPQGTGTVWYPQMAAISTSVGANDGATCAVYLGAQGIATLLQGQSYAGGGDTISLPVSVMRPGELLIAVWTGSTPGASCTLSIVGTMDALAW